MSEKQVPISKLLRSVLGNTDDPLIVLDRWVVETILVELEAKEPTNADQT